MQQYQIDKDNALLLAVFQYMIGNDDWYVISKHNIELLTCGPQKIKVAVPYDFDWSELVNAAHTLPKGIPVSKMASRRIYKGLCVEDSILGQTFQYLTEKKGDIENTINAFEYLPSNTKKQSIRYVRKFYSTIGNKTSRQEVFGEHCLSTPDLFKEQ